jgi:inward rectifier potassium channel
MRKAKPRTRLPSSGDPTTIRVVGARRRPIADFYHAFLRCSWWTALALIVLGYLALNGLFALGYLELGGVFGARPGSLADAFYFSIQTMGTIGYGAMYPVGRAANALVVAESVTGLIVTAVLTGLVFAKFSRTTGRLVFTREAVIAPMDGVPTLMVRIGNERSNQIMEAQIRLVMTRTERTIEGVTFYRMYDLPLTRDRTAALSRSWTVMHPITAASPIYGLTPAAMKACEIEVGVAVSGTDDTSLQPVHARKTYLDHEIVWGARHVDILSDDEDGGMTLDVRKFHDLVPTKPIAGFPYPAE